MSTAHEIEAALKDLPLQDAQAVAQWLQKYLEQQIAVKTSARPAKRVKLPDYAARRKMIFGDKVLPNLVLEGRELERW
jgi:hypothetical protein